MMPSGENIDEQRSNLLSRAIPDQRNFSTLDREEEDALRHALKVLRRRKLVVYATVAVCFTLSILVCLVMKPKYESICTLLIDKDDTAGIDLGSLQSLAEAAGGTDDVKTDLQTRSTILSNDSTILAVADQLGLAKESPFLCKPGLFQKCFPREAGLPLSQAPASRERFLKIFRKGLTVTTPPDTRLIQVAVQNPDPIESAVIANSLAEKYIQSYLETRFHATAQASHWLSGQLEDLKKQVQASQDRLSAYERSTGLSIPLAGMMVGPSTSSAGGSSGGGMGGAEMGFSAIPEVQRLAALNDEVTAAEENRIAKEAIYHLTQTNSPEVVLGLESSGLASVGSQSSVLSSGGGLTLLQSLRGQEAALKVQFADTMSKAGEMNPRVASMRGQIAALDQQISLELQRINERAKNDYSLAKSTEDDLNARFKEQKSEVAKVNDNLTQLEVLAVEALSSRGLYEGLYTKLQEAGITAGVKATNVSVADMARPSATPVKPNWIIYPLIGLAAGLFLGVVLAFARDRLDDAIVAPEDVEDISNHPLLSYVPLFEPRKAESVAPGGVVGRQEVSPLISNPTSPAAEQIRALRTAIQLSAYAKPFRTILVTSALGSEGKSTVTYNLAIGFAQQGKRVLVIDGDMRKPSMHRMFKLALTPGLSNVLTSDTSVADAAKSHPLIPSLALLSAGPAPPTSSELLASQRFDQLLAEAQGQYDVVLVDSPPVLLVADATILSSKVDATIMVVRSGVSSRATMKRMIQVLDKSPGYKLGFVLNGLDTRSISYYYSYGYYGESKPYGEES